ncbi:MAG: host attachment protein [Burkholderiales bacterium]|nr:host attachment protein [Burkholderiales bacterium]
MLTTWIVVADEGRARILTPGEPGRDLREIEVLTDPAARADGADLRRDAQGRYYGKGERNQAHSVPPRTDPLEKEAELFARLVAEHLCKARRENRFDRLQLVAAPRFLGRLRPLLDACVQEVVVDEVNKDLVNVDLHTLTQRFKPTLGGRALGA